MGKKEENGQRVPDLFGKLSTLQKFVNTHSKQFETLTDREIEVLTLVAKGRKNPAVADDLGISRATVQNHRASICKKLSIRNQPDYIKYALAFGLISF